MVFLVCQCIQLVEREKNAIDHMGQSKRIIFLQSAHTETDERVLFHQAQTLREAGHIVEIYGMSASASVPDAVAKNKLPGASSVSLHSRS